MILAAAMIAAASCSHSGAEWISLEYYKGLNPSKSFIPFSEGSSTFDNDALMACTLPGGEETVADALAGETKTTSTNGAGIIRALVSNIDCNKIYSYSGHYKSVDENGDSLLLSGRIILPKEGKISRVMIVSHYTIGDNAEAPSNEVTIESMYAAKGLAVIQSDYLGYGITADRVHPYLCSTVTARNVIDMYFASLYFLKAIGRAPEFDDVFLLGFSQGGAVTLSVAQELELNHPEVRVRLMMAGGGPYDICATYDTLMENDFTDYPCAIPMIIQGMKVGNHLDIDYKDFFQQRMVDNLDEWINTKNYTMGEITQLIGSKQISSIMTPQAMDKASEKMTDLYRAMVDNSAINEIMPSCPMYIFHSLDDKVVPFINADNLSLKMDNEMCNVTYNFGHYGAHQIATIRFFFSCMDLLKKKGDID